MKQTISLAIVMMLAISGVFAKDNLQASKHATVKSDKVSVTYGQPSKNGKVVFGFPNENPMIAYGSLWGTGDGLVTEVTLKQDCKVGGNKVPLKAGTYSLYTKPAPGEWIFLFSTQLKQNGTASFDMKKVVTSTWGLKKPLETAVEKFTITPKADGLLMEWDKTSVLLPMEFVN